MLRPLVLAGALLGCLGESPASAAPRTFMGLPPDSLPSPIAELRVVGRGAIPLQQRAVIARAFVDSVAVHGDSTGLVHALGLTAIVECELSLQENLDAPLHALASRASDETRMALGTTHPEFARTIVNLARVEAWAMQRRVLADSLMVVANDILAARLGPDHPDLAHLLRFHSEIRVGSGDFPGGTRLAERALAILDRLSEPDTAIVLQVLSALASCYGAEGRIEEAIDATERALRTIHNFNPGNIRGQAIVHSNLGGLLFGVGRYADAQTHYEIFARHLDSTGTGDRWYRRVNMAMLGASRLMLGDQRLARAYLDGALKAEPGADRSGLEYSTIHYFSGAIDLVAGSWGDAQSAFARGYQICRDRLGVDHPECAPFYEPLAVCLAAGGRGDSALAVVRAAKEAYSRYGVRRDSPAQAGLSLLEARLHLARGDTAAALIRLRELDAQGTPSTMGRPTLSSARIQLARLEEASGELDDAITRALGVEDDIRAELRGAFRVLPERQALLLAAVHPRGLDTACRILADHPDSRQRWARSVLDAVIRSRGLVLEELGRRGRLPPGDPLEQAAIVRYRSAIRELQAVTLLPSARADTAERLREILALQRERDESEQELIRLGHGITDQSPDIAVIGLDAVERRLPVSAALLSIVRVRSQGEEAGVWGRASEPEPDRYLAFILRRGNPQPEVVDLGDVEQLDRRIDDWHTRSVPTEGELMNPATPPESELRTALWAPIAMHLNGIERLIVVPDGAVARVPFETLRLGTGRYLIEDGPAVERLGLERDMVTEAFRRREARGTILALGGVDHDARPVSPQEARLAASDERASAPAADGYRSALMSCEEFANHRFSVLPASGAEVRELVDVLNVHGPGQTARAFTGTGASEECFGRLAQSARALHLATHSFHIRPGCAVGAPLALAALGGWNPAASHTLIDNPLTRCGLALAGANRWAEASPDEADGLLTGDEIAGLDLSHVEFVVLSACNTGLGDVLGGEGVLGLQRAFKIAGAGPVVMSLWPVEDQVARQWMRYFYAARLSEGVTTAEATRRASLAMLAERRRLGLSTPPSSWAPFVSVGVER